MQGANVPPPDQEDEKPLPPPPPQFNKPVGAPPDELKAPDDFEGYMHWAKEARRGRMDMAMLWAQLAQADAMDRVASELNRLNEFLGTYDNEDEQEKDPEAPSARFSEKIAEGFIDAVDALIEAAPQLIERVATVLAAAGIVRPPEPPKKD